MKHIMQENIFNKRIDYMKYFTREMHEISQVTGWLSMDSTTLSNLEKNFIESNIGIEEPYIEINRLLRKHLPEHLRGRIDNIRDAIYLNKFDDAMRSYLAAELEKWKNDREQENTNNAKIYSKYLDSIEKLLPEGVQKLVENSLHDARLLAINRSIDNTVIFELDCSECCPPQGICILSFTGVKLFTMSDNALPNWWLHQEIELIDENCFKLQVLFNHGECELIAEDLILEIDTTDIQLEAL